jgi:hypothetical protein
MNWLLAPDIRPSDTSSNPAQIKCAILFTTAPNCCSQWRFFLKRRRFDAIVATPSSTAICDVLAVEKKLDGWLLAEG